MRHRTEFIPAPRPRGAFPLTHVDKALRDRKTVPVTGADWLDSGCAVNVNVVAFEDSDNLGHALMSPEERLRQNDDLWARCHGQRKAVENTKGAA